MTDISKMAIMCIVLIIGVYFAVATGVDTALRKHDTRTYLWSYLSTNKFASYLDCLHHVGGKSATGTPWPTSEICSGLNKDIEGQLWSWAWR